MQQGKRIQAGPNVIEHDAPSARQFFDLAQRRRLQNIESSKKYKTGERILPLRRNSDEGDELARDFVYDHETWVNNARFPRDDRRKGNAKRGYQPRSEGCNENFM